MTAAEGAEVAIARPARRPTALSPSARRRPTLP